MTRAPLPRTIRFRPFRGARRITAARGSTPPPPRPRRGARREFCLAPDPERWHSEPFGATRFVVVGLCMLPVGYLMAWDSPYTRSPGPELFTAALAVALTLALVAALPIDVALLPLTVPCAIASWQAARREDAS